MKRVITIVVSCLALAGCLNSPRLAQIEKDQALLANQQVSLAGAMDELMSKNKKLREEMEKKYIWARGDYYRNEALSERIDAFDLFKAEHDKRWPPKAVKAPVKKVLKK